MTTVLSSLYSIYIDYSPTQIIQSRRLLIDNVFSVSENIRKKRNMTNGRDKKSCEPERKQSYVVCTTSCRPPKQDALCERIFIVA